MTIQPTRPQKFERTITAQITVSQLSLAIVHLNELTGSPLTGWTIQENGTMVAHIGHYFLYRAGRRVGLHQIHNEQGDIHVVIGSGAKRELYQKLQVYMYGIREGFALRDNR